jgi:methionyl-tRNA synthetase
LKKFYITTAIDYPSGEPHMGHAYEKILADSIARWRRLNGEEVFFLTGTDEHGQKIERYAEKAGLTPGEFVDRMSLKFINLSKTLNISNDDFIRTTEKRHEDVCRLLFQKALDAGDIYPGEYEGPYCVDCERFFTAKELSDGKCPVHARDVETLKEKSYFFRLSRYREPILRRIKDKENFILPATRRNEIINRLEEEVKDLCISRSTFKWGVQLPNDPEHVIFVWFDALTNYVSGLGYPSEKFDRYWPCNLHVIGKDILWFHSVVWPAMLMSAGIPLPEGIFVHGFINMGGVKLSKSSGDCCDPAALADIYGVDSLRYFLLRETPYGEDGSFSEQALITRINNDLANDLGNLLSRTLAMVEKYSGGNIPAPGQMHDIDTDVEKTVIESAEEARANMESLRLGEALGSAWKLVGRLNRYVEETAPWALAKNAETGRLSTVLYTLSDAIARLSFLLYPFMPETAGKMREQLGLEKVLSPVRLEEAVKGKMLRPGQAVKKGDNLFDKITEKKSSS